MTPVRTYGVRDLIKALIGARDWASAAAELRDHAWKKYNAFAGAFGLGEAERPGLKRPPFEDMTGVESLFEEAMARALELVSPFAGFYEGAQIARLYRHHDPVITERMDATRDAIVDLLADLVTIRWAIPPAMTVTEDDLRAHGFDPDAPEPDESDFL